MLSSCSHALKEWAVTCAALACGRQSVLLRAGGIAEGPEGFLVEHKEFWLLPTRFHQSADELVEDAAPLLDEVASSQPPEGRLRLGLYARVESIHRLHSASQLPALDGLHILNPDTLHSRFAYREPGLFILTVRVYQRPEPFEIVDAPEYAGCHSWVELRTPLLTEGVKPVISDDEFRQRVQRLQSRLSVGGDELCDGPDA